MIMKDFRALIDARVKHIYATIAGSKNDEYASQEDVFHNFYLAGRLMGTTPEKALLFFKAKHDVSIMDIVDKLPDELPDVDKYKEKILDAVNYLILLEGLLDERCHMRTCGKCLKCKPEDEFYPDKGRKDGLHFYCKECSNIKSTEYYHENKEKCLEYQRQNREKELEIIRELKVNGCAICAYNKCLEALDFHHSDPTTKKFPISAPFLYRPVKEIVDELNKCILLCKNCHAEITEKEKPNKNYEVC